MNKKQSIYEMGQRIKNRREALGMSQQELADLVGYKSRSSINKIELGKNDILQSTIKKIAFVLNCTPSYLMGGADNSVDFPDVPSNIIPIPNMHKIPLLGTIACGEPLLAEENLDGYVEMPENVHADFCLRCNGDSMVGARIKDGDVVFIRQQPEVENGEIAAVIIDDEATLKRVYLSTDKIILQPENPRYEPFVYVGEELSQIRIIGKAVAFISWVE